MNDKTVTIGGHQVELSNLDKVLFPESGITKGELVDYYREIAEVALPHWRDRPLSMHRFPDGISDEGFFQKDVPDYFPDWFARVRLKADSGTVTYAVANDTASIVYLANQACITPHLALSRRDKPHHPDRLIFDLDPSDDDFSAVQEAARKVRALLDDLEVSSVVQTTGSRGLHIVVPLDRSSDFDAVRGTARQIAEILADESPDELTVATRKNQRGKRVFLDYLRNAYGQTSVAPYAVRAIEDAPVAMPVEWDEALAGDMDPRKYTIKNAFRRLAQTDDVWKGLGRRGHALKTIRGRLEEYSRR